MPRHDDLADREAVAWTVRVGDPAFDDWPAFQAWLEADPANAARYHVCADAVAASEQVPIEVAERQVRRRWPVWGGAVAASVALAIGYAVLDRSETLYAVETAPGATRVVTLPDGSVATLAGATRLVLDRAAPRRVTLERGEALFVVRHDARDPFAVKVGDATLVDVGTTFDATRTDGSLRLAVSDGAVDYVGGGLRSRVAAGQALRVAGDTAERSTIDPATVGGWRAGTFSYDGAPLSEVASDLARATGVPVTVAPALRSLPVRGTLTLDKRRGDLTPLAALLGLAVRRTAAGWAIDPAR